MSEVSIQFEPSGVTVNVPQGSLLLQAARQASVAVDAPCGGIGRCGRCRVVVRGAVSPLTDDERALLSPEDLAVGVRLACRTRVLGAAHVSAAPAFGRIRVVERSATERPEVEPPAVRGIGSVAPEEPLLGVAVDVGTTTLALALVDLRNGDEVAHASALNPQHAYGADVMSRVSAAIAGDSKALQDVVAVEIERLAIGMLDVIGASASHVREFSVVGNTAMRALLLAEDVSALAAAPYADAPIAPVETTTTAIGMRTFDAGVYVAPGVSAFIGGDIVAGMLITQLAEATRPTLFLDLGTNGEIVLVTGCDILATSAAAGPALEGASIENGMRAEPGAIERVSLQGTALIAETIDGAPARGICGSGLLDLVASMLDLGVLDSSGRLLDDVPGSSETRVVVHGDQRAFILDPDPDAGVVLTQRDVREIQLAKGAIRTAIDILLESADVDATAVTRVVIAGGFGLHVRGSALARIGMVPVEWASRLQFAGNTALAGAVALLVNGEIRTRAVSIAQEVRTIALAADASFQQRFVASLSFPQAR